MKLATCTTRTLSLPAMAVVVETREPFVAAGRVVVASGGTTRSQPRVVLSSGHGALPAGGVERAAGAVAQITARVADVFGNDGVVTVECEVGLGAVD